MHILLNHMLSLGDELNDKELNQKLSLKDELNDKEGKKLNTHIINI